MKHNDLEKFFISIGQLAMMLNVHPRTLRINELEKIAQSLNIEQKSNLLKVSRKGRKKNIIS